MTQIGKMEDAKPKTVDTCAVQEHQDQYWASSGTTNTGAVRKLNEDSFVQIPQHGVFVVADGMGGHEAGEVASQLIVEDISKLDFVNEADKVAAIRKSIQNSNSKILNISEQQFDGRTIGSTVVALALTTTHYNILWAGDSRVYLCRKGQLQQLTRDHSQVEELLASGLISEEEAANHPLSNAITRAVGAYDDLLLDEMIGKIEPGDIFLLCSDGLYNEISFNEMEMLIKQGNIADINKALIHSALIREAKDNVTSILVQINKTDN